MNQCVRSEAVGDVIILEFRETSGGLPDHDLLKDMEEIRRQCQAIGCSKVIVDLANVQFFGSMLLELIRVLWNDISAAGGRLVLCNPSEFGREVLEIAKFDRIWPIIKGRREALEVLGSRQNVALWPQALRESIARYDAGPQQLRDSLEGFSSVQLRTPAPPGAGALRKSSVTSLISNWFTQIE